MQSKSHSRTHKKVFRVFFYSTTSYYILWLAAGWSHLLIMQQVRAPLTNYMQCFCLAAEWNVYWTILKQFQLEVLKQNSRSRLCLYIVYSYCSAWAHNTTAWLNLLPALIVTVSCMHAVKYGNAFMCTRPMLSPLKHQHIDALNTKVVPLPLNTVTLLASIQQCKGDKALNINPICNRSMLSLLNGWLNYTLNIACFAVPYQELLLILFRCTTHTNMFLVPSLLLYVFNLMGDCIVYATGGDRRNSHIGGSKDSLIHIIYSVCSAFVMASRIL